MMRRNASLSKTAKAKDVIKAKGKVAEAKEEKDEAKVEKAKEAKAEAMVTLHIRATERTPSATTAEAHTYVVIVLLKSSTRLISPR